MCSSLVGLYRVPSVLKDATIPNDFMLVCLFIFYCYRTASSELFYAHQKTGFSPGFDFLFVFAQEAAAADDATVPVATHSDVVAELPPAAALRRSSLLVPRSERAFVICSA